MPTFRSDASPVSPGIRVRPDAETPLSFEQERLWFLQRLAPASSAYHLACGLRIEGRVDFAALAAAFGGIVERHEILRTSFPLVEGRVVAVARCDLRVHPLLADLTGLPEGRSSVEARRLAVLDTQRPFDPTGDVLIRIALLRLSHRCHVLLLACHRLVCDERSAEVLGSELAALYNAATTCRCVTLAASPCRYSDFSVWQRKQMSGDTLDRLLAKWRTLYSGLDALELPTCRNRPAVATHRGGVQSRKLRPGVLGALGVLADRRAAGLPVTVLAAFAALLYRYSAQSDFALGGPTFHRPPCTDSPQVGCFADLLVMRCDLSGNPSFGQLVERADDWVSAASQFRDLPFAKLLSTLCPPRDRSRHPLFQAALAHRRTAPKMPAVAAAEVSPLEFVHFPALCDLILSTMESGGGLDMTLIFAHDLFESTTVQRMLAHLDTLLTAVASDHAARVGDLPLWSPAQAAQVLREWNDTRHGHRPASSLFRLFSEQVRRTPDAVAVVATGEKVTFAELERRVARQAQKLAGLGVGPEVLVGICVERSVKMIIAMLAVLAAGGAYVPLDPTYPQERRQLILADSGARVVVSSPPYAADTTALDPRLTVLSVEAEAGPECEVPLKPSATNRHLAYLIYTSGSTGRPKGVAVEHRGVLALLDWARGLFSAADLAGVLAATSISFDLSVFEIFLPLTSGGTVVLADHALQLPRLPGSSRITLLNTVPSAADGLLRLGGLPASIRTVNLAGEPLSAVLVDKLYRSTGVGRVFDLYGPSEDTTYSTSALRLPRGTVTVGRPITNTRVFLLDASLRPAPQGCRGELCLAGEGLARGYLHRGGLTAEKFVPHPFAEDPGKRLYLTGDLARYLSDGRLELSGRRDHQIKMRGYRVEPGEIEALVRRHPRVRDVFVIKRTDAFSGGRLVAYFVPDGEPPPVASELQSDLRRQLPVYMVPSTWVQLDALPLTPNGKIDHRALPEPELADSEKPPAEPTSDEEFDLQQIWEEILGIWPVGITDDFFDLGGDSSLALRLLWRIREQLGVDLPLDLFVRSPVIAQLAPITAQRCDSA